MVNYTCGQISPDSSVIRYNLIFHYFFYHTDIFDLIVACCPVRWTDLTVENQVINRIST